MSGKTNRSVNHEKRLKEKSPFALFFLLTPRNLSVKKSCTIITSSIMKCIGGERSDSEGLENEENVSIVLCRDGFAYREYPKTSDVALREGRQLGSYEMNTAVRIDNAQYHSFRFTGGVIHAN